MANAQNANTFYIDATGALNTRRTSVYYVVVTATAANAILELVTSGNDTKKANLRVATSGDSAVFDFTSKPILFPDGVKVGTLTNAVATLIYNEG
jgi:hypothetical protein